jgi:hypothetical protein
VFRHTTLLTRTDGLRSLYRAICFIVSWKAGGLAGAEDGALGARETPVTRFEWGRRQKKWMMVKGGCVCAWMSRQMAS